MLEPITTTLIFSSLLLQPIKAVINCLVKSGYNEFKELLTLDVESKIMEKAGKLFKKEFLAEAQKDSIVEKVFTDFFEDEKTQEEISKIFKGQSSRINYSLLQEVLQGKIKVNNCRSLAFDFFEVKEFLENFIHEILLGAVKNESLYRVISYEKLSSLDKKLERRGTITDEVRALYEYNDKLRDNNELLHFVGMGSYRETDDIKLGEIFVMQRVKEELPVEKYSELLEEKSLEIPDERILREERFRKRHEEATPVKFEEVLNEGKSNRFVLLGDPGSGKSTLLKYLLLEVLDKSSSINRDVVLPIRIEIQDLARKLLINDTNPGYDILDYLYDYVRSELQVTMPGGFFEKYLEGGKVMLLFDGLDEVGEEIHRVRIQKLIHNFIGKYSERNIVIITSRIVGYKRVDFNLEKYRHFTAQPFDEDEIKQFINNWYKTRCRSEEEKRRKSEDLIETLEKQTRIKEIARNPLLLTIIALIHRIDARLPDGRIELYQKATEALLHNWEYSKRITKEEIEELNYKFPLQKKCRALEIIAFEILKKGSEKEEGETISSNRLKEIIKPVFCKNENEFDEDIYEADMNMFICLLQERTGLFVEKGKGQFGFVHKTFQEYFAAMYINREFRKTASINVVKEIIKNNLSNPYWEEVLLLAIRTFEPEMALVLLKYIVEEVNSFGIEEYTQRDKYFVLKFLAEQGDWLGEREFTKTQLLSFFKWVIEYFSISKYYSGKNTFKILQKIFPNIQSAYFSDVIEEEIISLLEDKNQVINLRLDCARGISSLGIKENWVINRLFSFVGDKYQQGEVRKSCIETIGNLGNKEKWVIEKLLNIAVDKEQEINLRCICIYAIEKLGNKEDWVLKRLLELAENKQREGILRIHCISAIGELGNNEITQDMLMELAEEKGQDGSLRRYCALAIANLGNRHKAIEILLNLTLDKRQNIDLRRFCVEAIGNIGNKEKWVIERLLNITEDNGQESYLRFHCAQTIGKLGNKEKWVIERLIKLAEDKDLEVSLRGTCARTIGNLGNKESWIIEALLNLAEDKEQQDSLLLYCAHAIGKFGNREKAVELLLGIAEDKEQSVDSRTTSVHIIGSLRNEENSGIDRLLTLAEDKEQEGYLRSSCVEAIGRLGYKDKWVIERLIKLAEDKDLEVNLRRYCAEAIGKGGRQKEIFIAASLLKEIYEEKADDTTLRAMIELVY